MSDSTLAPGDSVVALCSRCKDERRHWVVAVVGGVPVKVQCDTCQGVHVYKSSKSASSAKPAKPRASTAGASPKAASPRRSGAAAAKAAQAAHDEWERRIGGRNADAALPYAMTGCFAENALVLHPTFGLGVVAKTIRPDKMEVVFEAGMKLLRCVAK